MTPMPPSRGFENLSEGVRKQAGMPPDEGVREPIGSTQGCVTGLSAILRLIKLIVAESFPVAENEAPPATFPTSVSSRDKS